MDFDIKCWDLKYSKIKNMLYSLLHTFSFNVIRYLNNFLQFL